MCTSQHQLVDLLNIIVVEISRKEAMCVSFIESTRLDACLCACVNAPCSIQTIQPPCSEECVWELLSAPRGREVAL